MLFRRGALAEVIVDHNAQPPASFNDAASFWVGFDLDTLAEQQGVQPLKSLDQLWADFWPEDESLEDFVATVRAWRQHDAAHDFSARLP